MLKVESGTDLMLQLEAEFGSVGGGGVYSTLTSPNESSLLAVVLLLEDEC